MATQPTQLPVPSEKPQDLKFNAGKIDEYVTSMGWTYTDRFGNKHYTIEGINYLAQQVMSSFGYVTLSGVTFTTGATVSTPNEVLFNTADNSYYKWSGSFASGPKVVPENSTPESTGGTGPGKWLNVGDTTLRSDLATGEKANLVGYTNPANGDESTVDETLTAKLPNIIGSVNSPPTGFMFESFKKYSGDHDIRLTDHGSIVKSTKNIKKNGHATITLSSTVDHTPAITVDTVGYIDPTSFEGGFPQETIINGLTFEGDDDGLTEVGLTIHEGQRFQIKNTSFLKVKKALYINCWVTQLDFIMAKGQIHHVGGTSTTYNNVGAWVTNPSVSPGAFRLENLQYSNLRCCTSDGTVRTAYYIDNCNGLSMTSCACELPSAIDIGMGVAIHLKAENDISISDFICIPKTGEGNPIVSIGENNNVTFSNPLFSWGNAYSWDFYINGPNNNIIINGGKFGTGNPLIGCNDSASGSTVVYNTPTNSFAAKITSAQNALQLEPMRESRSIDGEVALTFGSSTTGIGVTSKDVKYVKNANLVTVEFDLTLNGSGGQTGQMRLRNMPRASNNQASGTITIVSGINSGVGPISVVIDRNSKDLTFYKLGSAAAASSTLTQADVTATARIRGSITYEINSFWQ